VALSGGGRSSCRRNFRRQAMAASVPRAAQRLQRAQDQFFLWSISRAPCGANRQAEGVGQVASSPNTAPGECQAMPRM